MSDFVHPPTCDIVLSVNDMPAPWIVCTRANALVWQAITRKYRKWVTDHIEEMTPAEKAAADAAELAAQRDSAADQLAQAENVIRAFMLVMLDEFNSHADKINAILTAIDSGANIGAVKANIAAIADYPQRTADQLKAAVRNKLGN